MHINVINAWADFWRNQVGMNVIPADSIIKRTFTKWKDDPRGNWQIDPIPQSIHNEWKNEGSFEKGMAIICGRVFHNEAKKHLYLCAIDADNKKGIDELTGDIEKLAKKTIVERHANLNKAHVYFYTTTPMQKKSSDAVNLEILEKMKNDEVPSLEVKGDGTHGIMYCSPSPHKDGSNYDIIGTKKLCIMDEVGEVINKICDKYSLGRGNDNKVPMTILMEDDTRIIEGSNRHEAIMRYAESMLRKYPQMEKSVFIEVIKAKNKLMCSPPLSNIELNTQIECAMNFIKEQVSAENELRNVERHKFGTDEFWEDVKRFKDAFKPKKKFIKCLECKDMIEANPLERIHYGHRVKLE
ncbi:hypothetical protein LCGC14_1353680 [marine sediment metagenome]|uniref:DNA primase/polymerase bifunctional N-terminal domain-containing protein n=1 Tax=marine sediment metagenome TaxID=412755 RepID=A0A0F9MQR8_9ZZZZ